MANYIPRGGPAKKKDLLAKREQELLKVIRFGALDEQVIRAAGRVREARLAVLKATKAGLPNDETLAVRTKKIDSESARWNAMTVIEIINEYEKTALA